VKRRLRAYRLKDNLPANLPIAVTGQIIDLLDPNCIDIIMPTLLKAEQDFRQLVRIAIFDTYNKGIAIGGGDEDKAKDQNRALGNLRRLQEIYSGIHVAAIRHTGKDESRGARGSNALPGDSDMQNQISVEGEIKIVTTTKANDAPMGELLRFRLEPYVFGNDEDGDPISVHVTAPEVIPTQATTRQPGAKPPKVSRAERNLRDAIIEVMDGLAETIQIANGQQVKAAEVAKVQAEFNKRHVVSCDNEDSAEDDKVARQRERDAKRQAFNRELKNLPSDFVGYAVDGRQWIYRLKDVPFRLEDLNRS